MPQKAWSDKRERQYEHIKDSYRNAASANDEAEERAARTVNKERAEHGETKASAKKRLTSIGYALSSEEHAPADLVATRPPGRGRRLRVRPHLRPLPPVDRPPGPEPVRLVASSAASPRRPRRSRSGPASRARRSGSIRRSSPTPPRRPRRLMPGRFFLGVGTGENLNEHILGDALAGVGRPRRDARGGDRGHPRALERARSRAIDGEYYTVENARIYTLPEETAADPRRGVRPRAATRRRRASATGSSAPARRRADRRVRRGRRRQRPALRPGDASAGAEDEAKARKTAHRVVADCRHPRRGQPGTAEPRPFRAARGDRDRGADRGGASSAGRTWTAHREDPEYVDAGYDHVYIHQVGPDQAGFLRFAERELLPALKPALASTR